MDSKISTTTLSPKSVDKSHVKFDLSFGLVLINLLLLCFAANWFNIESNLGLPELMPIIFGAFLINAFLPLQYRPPFFLAASIAAFLWVLGPVSGISVIVAALVLIGACHLPVSLMIRRFIVLAVVVVLILLRMGKVPAFMPTDALVVLSSLFMFRLMIYLFELKYEKESVPIWQRLNYFFMMPNLAFPIFPIVDYKTFYRNYYNKEAISLYQNGIKRMVRGLVHLLLYRIIYLYLVPSPSEITDIYGLIGYMALTFMMILRLSGLFHTATGILILFGYNLPEVFDNYFLSAGFNDFWRRTNIYWRDFMLKIFYYPMYFKVKHWGMMTALIFCTLIVFIINWFLHAWQWFWLLGDHTIRLTDVLYWGIFGLLVTASIVMQLQSNKKKKKVVKDYKFFVIHALKILGTFSLISFIWSLWVSLTVKDWIGGVSIAGTTTWSQVGVITLSVILIVLALATFLYVQSENASKFNNLDKWKESNAPYLSLGVLVLVSMLHFNTAQIDSNLSTEYSLDSFKQNKNNDSDEEKLFEGYYEEMLVSRDISSNVWQVKDAIKDSKLNETDLEKVITNDIMIARFEPNSSGIRKGGFVSINRWGCRDTDFEKEPKENQIRLALLGVSIEFGYGLDDHEVFEPMLEKRLNDNWGNADREFELLNFSGPARSLTQNLHLLREEIIDFKPDYVLMFIHGPDVSRYAKFLKTLYDNDQIDLIENNWERRMINKQGVNGDMSLGEIKRKINEQKDYFFRKVFIDFKTVCEENDIIPTLTFLPSASKKMENPIWEFVDVARKMGIATIDLGEIYKDVEDRSTITISAGDVHPNAIGQGLIADGLYEELVEYLELE